jgi:hypothetical protein
MEITDEPLRPRTFPHLLLGLPVGLALFSVAHHWSSLADIQYAITGWTLIPLLWTFLLPESPVWQLTHGQYEQAEQQLLQRARARAKLTEPQVRFRLQQLRERLIQDELDRVGVQQKKAQRSCCYSCSCSGTSTVLLLPILCSGVGLLFVLINVRPSLLASLPDPQSISPFDASLPVVDLLSLAFCTFLFHLRLAPLYTLVSGLFSQCVGLFGLLIFTHLTYINDRLQTQLLRHIFLALTRASALFSLASLCLYSAKRFRLSYFQRRIFSLQLLFFCVGGAFSSFLPRFVSSFVTIIDVFRHLKRFHV